MLLLQPTDFGALALFGLYGALQPEHLCCQDFMSASGLSLLAVHGLLDVVDEVVGIVAVEFDVMLLAEIVDGVGNLRACVCTLLGS